MKKIGILGSGSWGTAVASLLANKGYQVTLWSFLQEECRELRQFHENRRYLKGVMLPETIQYTENIREAVEGQDMVVNATPSFAVRSTVQKIKPYFQPDAQIIVNISKGFEESTLLRLSQVIREELGESIRLCILSGPSHAEEVGRKMPTTNVAVSPDPNIAKAVQDVFMCEYFRVYTSEDVVGVELGAALKNVIALCAGISDGLGYGDNLKAALMTRGMAEIMRLGVKMGGKAETFFGLTGMGDLIVTCTSMHSRNRRAGILIGQGKTPEEAMKEVNMVVEGVLSCKAAYRLAQDYQVEMPVVEEAYRVLFEGADVRESLAALMERDKKPEN